MVVSKTITSKITLFVGVLLFFIETGVSQTINDYYKIETIQIPEDIKLEVGGLSFNDKGNLGVCTRRGEVWLIDNPKSNTPNFKLFAQGMHENLGLVYKEGAFYTVQRSELTKLTDSNGDNEADAYQTIYDWGVSGNYHEYSFGPEIAPNGDMLITLNLGWKGGGVSLRKWRGWLIRINSKGQMTPYATGMRSPAGFGLNKNGDIFYGENQGDWVGSGRVSHIEKGDFLGHPQGLKWTKEKDSPLNLEYDEVLDTGKTMYEQKHLIPGLKVPSVWFPHAIMGISTSDIKLIPKDFGPYTDQLVVGDQGHSKVMRMSQEKVNGVYQGACFPFLKGFQSGVLRLLWSKEKDLYVGMTSRGWGSTGKSPYGLQRVEWTGKTPFDMKHIAVTPNGFEIEFTKPVNKSIAEKIKNYTVTDFTYKYHSSYGSPITNREKRVIQKIDISSDGMKAKLYLDNIRLGYIYEIKALNLRSTDNKKLVNNVGYYTINQLPGGKDFVPLKKSSGSTKQVVNTFVSTKRITQKPGNWSDNEIQNIRLSTSSVRL